MGARIKKILSDLNILDQCRHYKVSVFACPPFLFIVLGIIIIFAMVTTTVLAERFSDDPAVVVLSVSAMTAFLFVVGHAVVSSFQRLADASRMKSEFVSIVSHQLRSPLSAIKWQLELMLENVKTVKGEAEATIDILREQNERMIELVNDLLEVNRIEDDRLILRPTLVDVGGFVDHVVAEYKPLAEKSGLSLVLEPAARPLWIFVDESKLRWLLENLLDNAIRYSLTKGQVKVRVAEDGTFAQVEVIDAGIGVPIHDQGRIFGKFFRAENALRLRTQGSGLGLYLVKSLSKAMGGKVGFASLEGKGSTFWFAFPSVKGENKPV